MVVRQHERHVMLGGVGRAEVTEEGRVSTAMASSELALRVWTPSPLVLRAPDAFRSPESVDPDGRRPWLVMGSAVCVHEKDAVCTLVVL